LAISDKWDDAWLGLSTASVSGFGYFHFRRRVSKHSTFIDSAGNQAQATRKVDSIVFSFRRMTIGMRKTRDKEKERKREERGRVAVTIRIPKNFLPIRFRTIPE